MKKIVLTFEGDIVPKARPSTKSFKLPQKYRAWKNRAARDLYSQAIVEADKVSCIFGFDPFPLGNCKIAMHFSGKHDRHGDLDNMGGALLDAMQKDFNRLGQSLKGKLLMHDPFTKVLASDNCKAVSGLKIALDHDVTKPPVTKIIIEPVPCYKWKIDKHGLTTTQEQRLVKGIKKRLADIQIQLDYWVWEWVQLSLDCLRKGKQQSPGLQFHDQANADAIRGECFLASNHRSYAELMPWLLNNSPKRYEIFRNATEAITVDDIGAPSIADRLWGHAMQKELDMIFLVVSNALQYAKS